MKRKTLIISTILFLLIVHTSYFWEGRLGIWFVPTVLILVIAGFALVVSLVAQIYLATREKFAERPRLIVIGLLTVVVTLTWFFPHGLVTDELLNGRTLLIATREGAANCRTTLNLKKNKTFYERSVCFGVTEIRGEYHVRTDTVFFTNVAVGRGSQAFYQYAVIKHFDSKQEWGPGNFIAYRSREDSIGHEMWIRTNELGL